MKFTKSALPLALVAGCAVISAGTGCFLFGGGPVAAPSRVAEDPKPKEGEVPAATTALIAKVKIVIQAYWNASYDAAVAKQEFKENEGWEAAAKKANYKDYKSYDDEVKAQRKADPVHFNKLYEAARKASEKDYQEKIAKLEKSRKAEKTEKSAAPAK
jgi:hypothetical protein